MRKKPIKRPQKPQSTTVHMNVIIDVADIVRVAGHQKANEILAQVVGIVNSANATVNIMTPKI